MWVNVEDRVPKEDEYKWVNIRKGDKEYAHPCKVWESSDGTVKFVNICFEKEDGVTHWKEQAEETK